MKARRVLLHVCCGPCSLMPLRVLREAGYEVTGYFANPNIHPVSEYLRRREAMQQVAGQEQLPMIWQDDVYNLPGWLGVVYQQGLAGNGEGGRCRYCYASRLTLTAGAAHAHGFDAFSTSLLYSRHQRHEMIHEEGRRAAERVQSQTSQGPTFLYQDFRPHWQTGIDRSKVMGLYRQNYCACIFSEAERHDKTLRKLMAH